jgi:phosphoglycolate phosphatase-like HAD superfamily hydrolase
MIDAAVIFDVDGVLLELTDDEAELFFVPFAKYLDSSKLSRDWNSYRIRNDEDIIEEILELNGLSSDLKQVLINDYLKLLTQTIGLQAVVTIPISGAVQLLSHLSEKMLLGVATANLRAAAKLRLEAVGMWKPVARYAFGADGGGHKSQILARAIVAMSVSPDRIIYLGDNLNDLQAAIDNHVHFIAFSTDAKRRETLRQAGAQIVIDNHQTVPEIISDLLS